MAGHVYRNQEVLTGTLRLALVAVGAVLCFRGQSLNLTPLLYDDGGETRDRENEAQIKHATFERESHVLLNKTNNEKDNSQGKK